MSESELLAHPSLAQPQAMAEALTREFGTDVRVDQIGAPESPYYVFYRPTDGAEKYSRFIIATYPPRDGLVDGWPPTAGVNEWAFSAYLASDVFQSGAAI